LSLPIRCRCRKPPDKSRWPGPFMRERSGPPFFCANKKKGKDSLALEPDCPACSPTFRCGSYTRAFANLSLFAPLCAGYGSWVLFPSPLRLGSFPLHFNNKHDAGDVQSLTHALRCESRSIARTRQPAGQRKRNGRTDNRPPGRIAVISKQPPGRPARRPSARRPAA